VSIIAARIRTVATLLGCGLLLAVAYAEEPETGLMTQYQVYPIGWVRKTGGRTLIEVEERYRPALLGVEKLDSIWVIYWFDRNDSPEHRAVLQVHPRGNPDNPLRGVFATRAPVRPNLIALSRCRVLAVRENRIEIDGIDALPDTPVLDIKP
jgi:tRNA-Thr(GGU) m(6)t(6)A37 methyltransferase TsaA